MSHFTYKPSQHVPFADTAAIERCRRISRQDIEQHPNPDFRIRVLPDADFEFVWVTDMVRRLQQADGGKVVMILPNPVPTYRHVARLINQLRIDCRGLHAFAMDEYADHDGHIAPESWECGFTYAMKKWLWQGINPELRPPERQMVGFTDQNVGRYSQMILDAGGADICYSGPGWTGHLAFIEPDAPEFAGTLEEWKTFGARVCTLSPFTIAQNSLHGSFGASGDLAAVPPKAATIGPADVIAAKARVDVAGITVHGTQTSWQRLMARLCYHGPVTPKLPTSIHQQLKTDAYISESIAADITIDHLKGY